jgi:tRNA1Val (adenine37-N6)-methyltransferase
MFHHRIKNIIMASNIFNFKQFTINQDRSAFKVGTDGVILGACADVSGVKSILDIGTGTGLIALMLAQRSEADVTAIEPDGESFLQACRNAAQSLWADRIHIVNSDLQSFFPGESRYDLIVTNPPYFKDSLKNPEKKKASARHHTSLGFDDLLKGVSRLLRTSGVFRLILPLNEGLGFAEMAGDYGLYCCNILKIKPLPQGPVKRLILTFSKQQHDFTEESCLVIENGKRHEYTEEYKKLTGDFYLSF